ncbi:STAS domain-containing protein [Streptomyces sp. NBC_01298]|uniref:STAS domain-containing protein n=1 Tax=Streptomyces sp. NBC_01298 TaxID=2903817 RepID=UPI002E0E8FDF|nr:STAS domain-containing protein [Streptomyces sp. NBC_01298]
MTERSPLEADGTGTGTGTGTGITVEILDRAVTLHPVGEIDIDTASALRIALSRALTHASPARPVVVDCSRLTFCDSSGLNALLTARLTAQKVSAVIHLADPNDQLTRLLEMTGTLSLFPIGPHPPTNGLSPTHTRTAGPSSGWTCRAPAGPCHTPPPHRPHPPAPPPLPPPPDRDR